MEILNTNILPSTWMGHGRALTPIAAALLLCAASQQAEAFQLDTGSDWNIRFDNTVKYNYMMRVEDPSSKVYNQGNNGSLGILADDSTLGWDQWDTVSNRFDLLTELDVVWKKKAGFRVTYASWYDFAYSGDSNWDPNPAFPPGTNTWGALTEGPGGFTDDAKDLSYRGGEVLDAFVFANFGIGDMSGNVRAGRHTIYWGNSLLLTGAVHSVAGSMVAIDAAKGFAVPGSEAQELFLPTNKISTVFQITPNLTFNAFRSLEWTEYRFPVEGTYFSPAEIFTSHSEFAMLAPGFGAPGEEGFRPRIGQKKIRDIEPDSNSDWGINFQYYFNSWDIEAQIFYLNYADKLQNAIVGTLDLPAAVGTFGAAGVPPFNNFYPDFAGPPEVLSPDALGIGEFAWVYKDNIDLFGFALSKQIGDWSIGFDYVRRQDTALRCQLGACIAQLSNVPAPLQSVVGPGIDINDVNNDKNFPGPVGDTDHVVINGLKLLSDTALWDGGTIIMEAAFSRIADITKNEAFLLADAKKDDISTGIGIVFTPEYFQVFPGTDMKLPMSVSYTLDNGNEPAIGLGGNPGIGTGSIGAEFNVDQLWTVSLKYNIFFGKEENGFLGLLADRDNVSFTVKRTF